MSIAPRLPILSRTADILYVAQQLCDEDRELQKRAKAYHKHEAELAMTQEQRLHRIIQQQRQAQQQQAIMDNKNSNASKQKTKKMHKTKQNKRRSGSEESEDSTEEDEDDEEDEDGYPSLREFDEGEEESGEQNDEGLNSSPRKGDNPANNNSNNDTEGTTHDYEYSNIQNFPADFFSSVARRIFKQAMSCPFCDQPENKFCQKSGWIHKSIEERYDALRWPNGRMGSTHKTA